MRYAVITVAGQSLRFNERKREKKLKAIYHEGEPTNTLLYHQIRKIEHWADCIILVGGYQYEALRDYVGRYLPQQKQKIRFVYNAEYATLQSGYSLYLGLKGIWDNADAEEILFLEGDLDIDKESLERVASSDKSVLTTNREPIYADRAVILYQDGGGQYHYGFSQEHGLLKIDEAFFAIFNSGQVWKFRDRNRLAKCCKNFADTDRTGTNLEIIQAYLDGTRNREIEMVTFAHWINCNTRADYRRAVCHWELEDKDS